MNDLFILYTCNNCRFSTKSYYSFFFKKNFIMMSLRLKKFLRDHLLLLKTEETPFLLSFFQSWCNTTKFLGKIIWTFFHDFMWYTCTSIQAWQRMVFDCRCTCPHMHIWFGLIVCLIFNNRPFRHANTTCLTVAKRRLAHAKIYLYFFN